MCKDTTQPWRKSFRQQGNRPTSLSTLSSRQSDATSDAWMKSGSHNLYIMMGVQIKTLVLW